MAINLPKVTYDSVLGNRAPVVGDVARQFNPVTYEDEYAIYDGTTWKKMNAMGVAVTAGSITGVPSPAGNYHAVSGAATTIKNDVVTMIEKNIRVAEIYDSVSQKLKRAELQFREGPGSSWEPIQRVKLYE